MLDNLLEIAATPDWISPTFALIQTFFNRPSVGFNVPTDTEWSTYAINDLLSSVGIKVWGLTIASSMIIFRVRKAQARYTHYMLERAGVPYYGGLSDYKSSDVTIGKNESKPQSSTGSLLDDCLDGINSLVDTLGH